METITILGAGAMGSALATPLIHNGHEVRLWGTELDDQLLAAIRSGQPHPRLGVVSGQGARLFPSAELGAALDGATLAVIAVTSPAALAIYSRALPHMIAGLPVAIVSKGFGQDSAGRVRLIPDVLDEPAPRRHPFVAIGGPCKANEVAAGWPTVAVFAAANAPVRQRCATIFLTGTYVVLETDDLPGLELAAATKNAYAITLGICDGLTIRDGHPWHNLKAALFALSLAEMALLAGALGGHPATVFSFSGAGDLEVTAQSGRNRALGELIGRGTAGDLAIAQMEEQGQTVEGPAAARLAWALVQEMERHGDLQAGQFPLLNTLVRILQGEAGPGPLLSTVLASLGSADA